MLASQKRIGLIQILCLIVITITPTAFGQTVVSFPGKTLSAELTPGAVLGVMEKVADWQLANPSAHKPDEWTVGALYTGMMALGGISGDPKYLEAMVRMGESNQWKLGPRQYDADDHCVGQTYAELY